MMWNARNKLPKILPKNCGINFLQMSQDRQPESLPTHAKIKSSWTGSSMVEQLTLNQRVVGSSPTRFTISLVYSSFRSRLGEVGHNWAQNLGNFFHCAAL